MKTAIINKPSKHVTFMQVLICLKKQSVLIISVTHWLASHLVMWAVYYLQRWRWGGGGEQGWKASKNAVIRHFT